ITMRSAPDRKKGSAVWLFAGGRLPAALSPTCARELITRCARQPPFLPSLHIYQYPLFHTALEETMNVLRIAAVAVICSCFALSQTPATPQTATTGQQSLPQITKGPTLEFANANSAKIAWTSAQGAQMTMHYGTDPKNLNQPIGAVDTMKGDNHRVSIPN